MADIRIKDLTTLESASLTGDVFVIDGTTGTRKLSAYSPSFGGNATVGGTLTVSGSGDSTLTGPISWGTTTPANAVLLYKNSNTKYGNGVTSGSLNNFVPSGDNKHSWGYMSNSDGTTYTELVKLTANTGVLAVLGTTASTTTSSGALVVGNGTSGGLGVGGNITLGGGVNIAGAASDPLPAGTSGIWTLSGSGLRINSAGVTFASLTGTTLATATLTVNGTTASTSTSSGALVVGNGTSGGLGVGGAIWAGGDITISTNTKAFYNLNYANAKGQQAGFFSRGTDGAWTAGMHFYSSNTDYSASIIHFPGTGDLQFYTNSTSSNYTSSDEALRITPAKQIQVKATTGSTGTSSGALVVSGGVGVAGAVNAGTFYGLVDGVTAPATESGYARIYVDSADGDLKVKFGDGTVKTIATDS